MCIGIQQHSSQCHPRQRRTGFQLWVDPFIQMDPFPLSTPSAWYVISICSYMESNFMRFLTLTNYFFVFMSRELGKEVMVDELFL